MSAPKLSRQVIEIKAASELTKAFRAAYPGSIKAFYFGRNAIETLLETPGSAGVRYYHGYDKDRNPHIVLVAVDANGEDMLGDIFQRVIYCPPICPEFNQLNNDAGLRVKKSKRQRDFVFTGYEDHHYTLEDALELTRSFQDAFPERARGGYFEKAALRNLLDTEGCVGIRLYNGFQHGEIHLIATSAARNLNDIITENLCIGDLQHHLADAGQLLAAAKGAAERA